MKLTKEELKSLELYVLNFNNLKNMNIDEIVLCTDEIYNILEKLNIVYKGYIARLLKLEIEYLNKKEK